MDQEKETGPYQYPECKLAIEVGSANTSVYVANLWGLKEFIHTDLVPGPHPAGTPPVREETGAIQCALVCAFEPSGKAEVGHFSLFDGSPRSKSQLAEWAMNKASQLNHRTARYLLTGINVSERYRIEAKKLVRSALNIPPDALLTVFTDNSDVTGLKTTPDKISMLYWFPKHVVKTEENKVLLIKEPNYALNTPPPPDRIWYQTEFHSQMRAVLNGKPSNQNPPRPLD